MGGDQIVVSRMERETGREVVVVLVVVVVVVVGVL